MDRHLYPVALGQPFRSRDRTPPLLMFKVFPTEPLPAGRDSTKRYRISWAIGKRLVTRRLATPKTALLTLSRSMRTILIMIPVE